MNKKLTVMLLAAALGAGLVGGALVGNSTPTSVQGPAGSQGPAGPQGEHGRPGRDGAGVDGALLSKLQQLVSAVGSLVSDKKLGAIPGNVISGESFQVNGVETFKYSSSFNFASTSLCSIRTPGATTTLVLASAKVRTATSTDLLLEWGKATVPNATTTSLGTKSLASGAVGIFLASTTPAEFTAGGDNFDDQRVLAPRTYLELKAGGFSPSSGGPLRGDCKIELVVN